jgi:sec-independent protein translocase protein TatA
MGWDAPWHWVVLAVLVVLLLGYKKLPDASRSLGRSLRIFKTEIKGMGADDKASSKALPAADVVKRDAASDTAERGRPRPSPSPPPRS